MVNVHMNDYSLLGIDSETIKGLERQQRYFPYRYALVRKYLPIFVNGYQKRFGVRPIDFAVLPTEERIVLGTLQTDFSELFVEMVCKSPGITTYAKYLKMTLRLAQNDAISLEHLNQIINKNESSPAINALKANILHELKLTLAFTNFYNFGKNIFDFPQKLLESFKNTNIENIPLRDVKLPYSAFYLHFGLQKDFKLEFAHVGNSELLYSLETGNQQENQYFFEGVYVKKIASGGFELALVGCPDPLVLSDNWMEYPAEAVFVKIPLIHPDITIGEALDWEVLDASASQKKAIFSYLEDNNLLEKIDVDYNIELLNEFLFYDFDKILDDKCNEILLKILKLVINAIFYITNYHGTEEIVEEIPISVPNDLRQELESDDADTRNKAISKFQRQGYSLVKICGKRSCSSGVFLSDEINKFDNFQQEAISNTESKRQFSSYHRRRHYRLCSIGKGRNEEALIWVECAYVQGTLPPKEGLRIYEFSQPKTSGTNVDNCDKTILNNKQILEIRDMFGLGVATISEIANLYRLSEEIIERIIAKGQQ